MSKLSLAVAIINLSKQKCEVINDNYLHACSNRKNDDIYLEMSDSISRSLMDLHRVVYPLLTSKEIRLIVWSLVTARTPRTIDQNDSSNLPLSKPI